LGPIFRALPAIPADEDSGRPEVVVLGRRSRPPRRAARAPTLTAAAAAVACAAVFGTGALRDQAPPAPVSDAAPAVVSATAPAAIARASVVAPAPRACAGEDCREVLRERRTAAPARVRRVASRHAPRPLDWSLYERATRPIFRGGPGPAGERAPPAAGRWTEARRVAANYTRPFDWSRYERETRPMFRGGGSAREPASTGLY
jgi:hypothetical protein